MFTPTAQAETIRQYVPLTVLILSCKERVVNALTLFQRTLGGDMPVRIFKALQSVLDWRSMPRIIEYLESAKSNPNGLAALCNQIAKEAWCSWHITHPEHDDLVHEARRMSPVTCSQVHPHKSTLFQVRRTRPAT